MAYSEPLAHQPSHEPAHLPHILGWGFVGLGAVAILAPAATSTATAVILALAMLLWGGMGAWMSFEMRERAGWRASAAGFGLLATLGLFFLLFPAQGVQTLALFIVAALLLEGVVSILLGLGWSGRMRRWGLLVASGATALIAGLVVLLGWPNSADWLIGVVLGVNFLTTGLALLAVRGAMGALTR